LLCWIFVHSGPISTHCRVLPGVEKHIAKVDKKVKKALDSFEYNQYKHRSLVPRKLSIDRKNGPKKSKKLTRKILTEKLNFDILSLLSQR